MRNLNRGQRIVAIVGWAVILWFVGSFVSTLGEPGAFGWVAYAPLSRAVYSGPGLTLTPLEDLLLWLALVVAWVGGAMLLLRGSGSRKDERAE
jgi:heme/copper-type cytochrome/quinol oxidase subunit 1